MIFSAAEQEFEDNRVNDFEEWKKIKPTTPMGQMPVLEVTENDGTKFILSQSITCARFLANRFNMTGSNEYEKAEADQWADLSLDLFNANVKIYFEKDETKKADLKEKYLSETIPNALKLFEAKLNKTNTSYLVGNKLTWADLYLHNTIDNLALPLYKIRDVTLDKYPLIKKHFHATRSLPGVAKYLATRPESEH